MNIKENLKTCALKKVYIKKKHDKIYPYVDETLAHDLVANEPNGRNADSDMRKKTTFCCCEFYF